MGGELADLLQDRRGIMSFKLHPVEEDFDILSPTSSLASPVEANSFRLFTITRVFGHEFSVSEDDFEDDGSFRSIASAQSAAHTLVVQTMVGTICISADGVPCEVITSRWMDRPLGGPLHYSVCRQKVYGPEVFRRRLP